MGAEERNIEALRRAAEDETRRFIDDAGRSGADYEAGNDYSRTDEGLLAVRSAQLVYSMDFGRALEQTHLPKRFTIFRGREARKMADQRIKTEYFGLPYRPISGMDWPDFTDKRSYVFMMPDQSKHYTATEAYQHSWLFHGRSIAIPGERTLLRDLDILRHTAELATSKSIAEPIFHIRTLHQSRVALEDFAALVDGVELDELQVVAREKKAEALHIVNTGLRSLLGHLRTKSGFAKSLKLALPTFE